MGAAIDTERELSPLSGGNNRVTESVRSELNEAGGRRVSHPFQACRHSRTGTPGSEEFPMLGLYEWLHETIEEENATRQGEQ